MARHWPTALILLLFLIGCGGHLPPPATADQSPLTGASVFNESMVGQTWCFQNGHGDANCIEIQSAPPNAACRGGHNLVMHFTKTQDRTYWALGVPQAELWFVLHQNPDGSWRSSASLINMPQGCPWCPPGPYIVSSDVFDAQPGMPLPYLIAPPDTLGVVQDGLFNETRVNYTSEPGLSFNCNIPSAAPLVGPKDGEYWRTDFYQSSVTTPVYSGPAIVSDQYEGICGHERWYFAPNLGLVKIESPYDGGEIKNDPMCDNWPVGDHILVNGAWTHDPNMTIERIH
ncbi:MAG: hypothetical protein LAO78_04120 [Acidobacteriia bacterium]|nr:hypothetical protein [Terriglobia bacterium]